MKRSSFITWDQLKVGGVILAALLIIMVGMYKLGQAANLFAKRYELVTFLPEASGLRAGGQVTVAGQLAGSVKSIQLLPVDYDTTRNLRLVLAIDRDVQEQIRSDSRARIRTMGLLGDKTLDVSPGTPRYAPLKEGDTLRVQQSLDYEAVLTQAAGAVGDVVALTRDLRSLTGGLVRGEGTMGQLMTNRALYDQLTGTLERTNAMLVRLQSPNGTVGRLLESPEMYDRLNGAVASLDSLAMSVNNSRGTVGKLLRDTTLYASLATVARNADSLSRMLANPNGPLARLATDQTLYDQLLKAVTDINAILADVRRDPRRYTKGMVGVCLFGCGKK